MRLALSSFTYTWAVGVPGTVPDDPLTPEALLDRAIELGADAVQYADNLPLDGLDPDRVRALADRARAAGIALEVGTRGIGPRLAAAAEVAVAVGSPFVRIVVDAGDDRPTPDEVVDRLSAVEELFRGHGLMLAIENHDRFPVAELISLADRLGDWVGFCLDTVNSLGCLEPPDVVIAALGPRAINVHLKDFAVVRHGHQMGFTVQGAPAGEGMLDLDLLLGGVDHRRVSSAVIELWTPPQHDLAATIALEADWARRSVGTLRARPEFAGS